MSASIPCWPALNLFTEKLGQQFEHYLWISHFKRRLLQMYLIMGKGMNAFIDWRGGRVRVISGFVFDVLSLVSEYGRQESLPASRCFSASARWTYQFFWDLLESVQEKCIPPPLICGWVTAFPSIVIWLYLTALWVIGSAGYGWKFEVFACIGVVGWCWEVGFCSHLGDSLLYHQQIKCRS